MKLAISRMKAVGAIGQYLALPQAVAACVESGCYHIENAGDLTQDVEGFSHIHEENPYSQNLSRLRETMKAVDIPPPMGSGKPDEMAEEDVQAYLVNLQSTLEQLHKKRDALRAEVVVTASAIEQLGHFFGLNQNLDDIFRSSFIKVRFGRLPTASYQKLQEYDKNPYVYFLTTETDKNYHWGMYVAPLGQESEIDRIFARLFFERMRIPGESGTPKQAVGRLSVEKMEKQKQISQLDEQIQSLAEREREQIQRVYRWLIYRSRSFEVRRYSARFKDTFMLVGWVPASDEAALRAKLDTVDAIEYRIDSPEAIKKLTPPSSLRNFGLFRPFEYYVNMYGFPNYREVDPTMFVAISYCVLFGIMFADVGQGILLALAGYFVMWKWKHLDVGKILIPCGIFGALGGLVFGSVFGAESALDDLYRAVGLAGKPVDAMSSASGLLIFSIGCGVFLILFAMCLNIISNLRIRNYEIGVFGPNGAAGLLFFLSVLGLSLCLVLGAKLPAALEIAWLVVGILLPLFAMLFKGPLGKLAAGEKDWRPEKIGEFIIENFFELFETVLTYVTNTLSFMRVSAFVLVHTGLMMVFYIFYDMAGNLLGGTVGIFIVIVGNAFVILLEGLLVSIQALRLEFYEMFSRFYAGDGRGFAPLNVNDAA